MDSNEIPFDELLAAVVDNRGRSCPTAPAGIPLIATKCIRNDDLYPARENLRYVSRETYDTWFRAHPLPGDIIFVNKGTPGRVCLAPDPVDFVIAQDMVAVRADARRVYPKYLFAALRSADVQEQIGRMHVGTMIPHFKRTDFHRLKIPVPVRRRDQEFIGDAYFALSAKIDSNRRIIHLLESATRGLFQSWFVDFDPVVARVDGGLPRGVPKWLAAELPDGFVPSPIGEVPRGWQVRKLTDFLNRSRGRSYSRSDLGESDTALVSLKSVKRGGGYRADGLKSYTGPFSADQVVDEGDIVLACTDVTQAAEVIGRPARVVRGPERRRLVVSLDLLAIRPKTEALGRDFLYWLLASDSFRDHALGFTNGTTVLHLDLSALSTFLFAVPPDGLVTEFNRLAAATFSRLCATERENCRVAELREMLMPQLMYGPLRIREAERMVVAAI